MELRGRDGTGGAFRTLLDERASWARDVAYRRPHG